MKRFLPCIVYALLLALTGCGKISSGSTANYQVDSVAVIDDIDGKFSILAVPRRIVSISPAATDILVSENAGAQIVGASRYCVIPPAEQSHVTRIGGVMDPDYERILALKPDLVVVPWLADKTMQEKLKNLGLQVLVMHPEGLAGTIADLRMIGAATGHIKEGEARAKSIESIRDLAIQRLKDVPMEKRPRVLIIMDDISPAPGAYVDDLLTAAGGRNVLPQGSKAWLQVSPETILQLAPDIIIQVPSTGAATNASGQISNPAAKTITIPDGAAFYHPGPDVGNAIWILARALHPDRFPEASPPVSR